MNIFIICSKKNYHLVGEIEQKLKALGHTVEFPNCFGNIEAENQAKKENRHVEFKQEMYANSAVQIALCDAVLVVNMVNEPEKGYIGGATFLEIYDAFLHNKKIYMMQEVTQSVFADGVHGFEPIILNDLNEIET